jgi:hypothetical protein
MTIQLQQRSLTLEIQQTQQRLDELLQEFHDQKSQHDEKLRRTLVSHVGTVYRHIHDLRAAPATPYMITEGEVIRIEARTREEVMVMTPDFHYELEFRLPDADEEEDTYPEIIAANLLKEPQPVSYQYVIRGDGKTIEGLSTLLRLIFDAMKKLDSGGRSDDALREIVRTNYEVRTLSPNTWDNAAAAAVFGFAIYKVSRMEEWLIQYPPLRFSGLNVCVPVNDRDGREALSSMKSCFGRYFAKAKRPAGVYEKFLQPNMRPGR